MRRRRGRASWKLTCCPTSLFPHHATPAPLSHFSTPHQNPHHSSKGSSFSGSAVATQRASTSASTITMARNPLKAMKIRTRRLQMNEKDKLRVSVFRYTFSAPP